MTQHPITPSPELRDRWRQAAPLYQDGAVDREDWLIDSAAQWGLNQCRRLPDPAHFLGVPLIPPADCTDSQSWIAMRIYQMGCDQRGKNIERERQEAADQELEACCEFIYKETSDDGFVAILRAARRPEPPSLKEQALADFDWMVGRTLGRPEFDERSKRIRRALESIPDPS